MQERNHFKEFFNQALVFMMFVVLTGVVGITAFIGYRLQQDTSSEDASAIVDGKLETGYPAAAYLLSQDSRGSLRECGSAIIEGNRAVTAAHCVDRDSSAFIGVDRPDAKKSLVTTAVNIHPSWTGASDADSDLAIISLADDRSVEPARIGSPRVGCNYIIVGYGQDERGLNGLRKSADVCIESVDQYSMKLGGLDGTACFGDSGSPVFKKDTNEVVGIVSQILTTAENPCARTDSIRATRIDSNLSRIFAPQINFAATNVDQPINLDLLLVSQAYLGDNRYEIEINADIVNNTNDPLSELSMDWCINEGNLQNVFNSVTLKSDTLELEASFGENGECHLLTGNNILEPFSTETLSIAAVVQWPSSDPMPIDMFVSGVIGDQYRVFALSNNRDLPQVLPNSSTLLIDLEKPLINQDNQQTLILGGGALLGMIVIIGMLNYIRGLLTKNEDSEQ